MANIRKITHPARRDGSQKTSWRATWVGADSARQSKNFDRKGEAQAWLNSVSAGLVGGSSSMTLAQLGDAHLKSFHALVLNGRRRAVTADGYQWILDTYVRPHVAGRSRLSNLRAPDLQALLDHVLTETNSISVTRKVRGALVTWCRYGVRRGWLMINPAQACAVEGDGPALETEPFALPPKAHLAALLAAADTGDHPQRDAAIVRILMFGGLRISELLGMADDAAGVTPAGGKLKVRERLDRHHMTLDPPKSQKGQRVVPIGKATALAIRAWRLARGAVQPFDHVNGRRERVRAVGRLFPDPKSGGSVWSYNDFMRECWLPLMRRAGLVEMLPDSKGKNRPVTAFTPHDLRHVAVSLWLEQRPQPSPKKIQEKVGHATLQMTMDLYGHLWLNEDEDDAMAQASERLIGGLAN